uniref:Uncharacterized protein n=1 Tax=Strongyloides papillosus TaxID=174720 RepID=A0A0N5BUS1_STREA
MTKMEFECLKGWTKYLSHEWYCTSPKELKKISKFGIEIRNTNGSEMTNKQINSSPYLRKRRGVIGVIMLCQKLDKNVRLKEFNQERFKYEERFAFRPRNPDNIEKENKLKKLQDELKESNFSDINTYVNGVAEIFMSLKFKKMFQEMISMLEVSEAVLKKEEEDLSSEEKILIEDILTV